MQSKTFPDRKAKEQHDFQEMGWTDLGQPTHGQSGACSGCGAGSYGRSQCSAGLWGDIIRESKCSAEVSRQGAAAYLVYLKDLS